MASYDNIARAELPITSIANAAYTVSETDRLVFMPTQTAPRILTLPLAASLPLGTRIIIHGGAGTSAANNIRVARTAPDTINGGVANVVVVNTAWGRGSVINLTTTGWQASPG